MTGDFETRFIWQIMEKTDVAAACPGPRELGMWSTFQDLMDRGTIPVIESNVMIKKNGHNVPIGQTYKVFTVNGIKVVVFSLMGGSEFSSVRPQDGVEFAFQDPFQTAGTLVPELHKLGDVVVLMSEMQPSDTDRLIQAVPGIDVALYGQRAPLEEVALKVGDSITNRTSIRGQYAGRLTLIVDPSGKIIDFGSQNVALDKTYPEDPDIVKLVNATNDQTAKMREAARQGRQTDFENKLTGDRFLGAETCKRCHEKQYEQWKTTPHAMAFASLDKPVPGKPKTAQCTQCHATGYGKDGGFAPDASHPDLKPTGGTDLSNVQCEVCHGMGTAHSRTGKVLVAESTCTGCHTSEWSPKFDFQKALLAVKH